ncbi:unnamed protein product [Adineta steineri]|uniref:Mitochondria-eating protein n=1 Tax=Adineta steineri TaxID=433720 RepID=A0A815BUY8_9BILA|nr:unnamed protein product [Adineta steineri]CAF1275247.1 unnamed protein product [Adineta steineri]
MSNAVKLQFIYDPQQPPPHIIDTEIQKSQPPANKLVNRYISTAAQYLNRTKSFHVTPTNNNHNNIHFQTNRKNISSNNLIQSSSTDMSNTNCLTTEKISIPTNETYTCSLPLNDHNNNDSINANKPQGLVNTLRRSLKKNRERFYNKQSTAMKSCQTLNTCEQTTNDFQNMYKKISKTPTLHGRRQTLANHIPISSITNTINEDQLHPLQPLANKNRLLANGHFVHHQLTPVLPPAASLQSLSPLTTTGSVTFTTPTSNIEQQSIQSDNEEKEKEKLKNDLQQLKSELQKSKETIARLQKSEEQMRERLAEQAQRQLEKGGKFEDLNQISRPTELIRSYNSLYSQARIDALDALDSIREMIESEDLKSKLLFSVVVLAFRHAQNQAKEIRNKVKQILQLSNDKSSITLEETIEKYLRSTIQKYDIGKVAFEVENQLWATLYDYPALRSCNELLKYITSACRTAWGLANQTPPYYIEFQTAKFDKQIHERFHTSDNESDTIIEYIWPCLIDGRDRACVAKGVVITDEHYLSISKTISS